MTPTDAVVHTLERLAFALAVQGEDFKAKAYAGAAHTLRSVPGDLAEQRRSGALAGLKGIGASVLAVVDAVLDGRVPDALQKADAAVPPGLYELRKLPSLGPSRIRQIHQRLGVTNLAELEYAIVENRLADVEGFGPKTQGALRDAIAALRANEGWFRVDRLADTRRRVEAALPGAAVTGDVRRGEELARTLDVLVPTPLDLAALARVVTGPPQPDTVGPYDAVRVDVAGVPVRIVPVEPDRFGVALLWSTGPTSYVEEVVARAATRGLALTPTSLSGAFGVVPTPDEATVITRLDLVEEAPERRHVPVGKRLGKRLLRREDLRGALHNHTTASDGTGTLLQMQAAAHAYGLSWLGITDHSPTAWYANGLDAGRLLAQVDEIAGTSGSCVLFSGVESDILGDGSLDHPDDVLARVDVVVASVHSRNRLDRAAMTARLVAAASNPRTHVIGHPTGRLLLGRPPADFDVDALIAACAASGCALEHNASPHRLDLDADALGRAREAGVWISIAADAHGTDEIAHLDYGVVIARRAGLGPDDVLNTLDADALRTWLRRPRSPWNAPPGRTERHP